MQQKRFKNKEPVLNQKGRPNPGWASQGILQYSRKAIRAPFHRIKEWNWYQVSTDEIAVQFTFGHASYAGMVGIYMFNFVTKEVIYLKDIVLALPLGSLGLDSSADDDSVVVYDKKGMYLRFETKNDVRKISCKHADFEANFTMTRTNPNALVINIPYDNKPRAFYYNHKINCMQASGEVNIGAKTYTFEPGKAWGLLDWGRGVWPFHAQWYWSNASGLLGGEVFGFNLGCGFGNTDTATENCVFYKNEMHKLGKVDFLVLSGYDAPWRLVDKEGRLDLTLVPVYDRNTKINLLWVDNECHQMFGKFNGYVVLDNGLKLEVKDIVGFAEHSVNNW